MIAPSPLAFSLGEAGVSDLHGFGLRDAHRVETQTGPDGSAASPDEMIEPDGKLHDLTKGLSVITTSKFSLQLCIQTLPIQ